MAVQAGIRQKATLSSISIQTRQHNNPLCRVVPIEISKGTKEEGKTITLDNYDKEKYREMVLDAAETVLGFFGFDRTVYSNFKKKKGRKWYEELREERTRDIQTRLWNNKGKYFRNV